MEAFNPSVEISSKSRFDLTGESKAEIAERLIELAGVLLGSRCRTGLVMGAQSVTLTLSVRSDERLRREAAELVGQRTGRGFSGLAFKAAAFFGADMQGRLDLMRQGCELEIKQRLLRDAVKMIDEKPECSSIFDSIKAAVARSTPTDQPLDQIASMRSGLKNG